MENIFTDKEIEMVQKHRQDQMASVYGLSQEEADMINQKRRAEANKAELMRSANEALQAGNITVSIGLQRRAYEKIP